MQLALVEWSGTTARHSPKCLSLDATYVPGLVTLGSDRSPVANHAVGSYSSPLYCIQPIFPKYENEMT